MFLWIQDDVVDYATWDGIGLLLSKLGKLQESLKAFDKSIKLNNKYFYSWYDKGITLGKAGLYKEALNAFERAISIKPTNSDAKEKYEITLRLTQQKAQQTHSL